MDDDGGHDHRRGHESCDRQRSGWWLRANNVVARARTTPQIATMIVKVGEYAGYNRLDDEQPRLQKQRSNSYILVVQYVRPYIYTGKQTVTHA